MIASELANILMEYPDLEVMVDIGIKKRTILDKILGRNKNTYHGFTRPMDVGDIYYGNGQVAISIFIDK